MENQPQAIPPAPVQAQTTPPVSSPSPVISKNSGGKGKKVLVVLVILLLCAAVVGVYLWQHGKVTSGQLNVSSLNSKVSQLDAQVSKLKSEASKKTSTSNSTSQPTASTKPTSLVQAVQNYKDNQGKASEVVIKDVYGVNAYGSVSYKGQDGGGGWLAHSSNGTWSVVSQGSAGICKDEVQQYNLPVAWESSTC